MLNKSKKIRRRAGQFLRIDLGNGKFAIARVMAEPVVAFYDKIYSRGDNLNINDISNVPVAFKLPVMNHAITSGKWDVLGALPLDDKLKIAPVFFKQDAVSGALSIYQEVQELAPTFERSATLEECQGLERAAVWEPAHVEDRLRDHFDGRPNRWVESLKLRT